MRTPPRKIDGARVVAWAWSGDEPFGHVGDSEGEGAIAIFGLAICQYDEGGGIYRFSCDKQWVCHQDSIYATVEDARQHLPEQYRHVAANWTLAE